ncbi:MAG TPA: peptidoglycan DD-metalloendopeptidase family protein [Vicinamibacterales bacterium]|jgi:murein DD-endopeptidase MepM/ murein hydrolase activator NlpD|nr:peptidoglycan DD-metalloendopeptidase family protein [Vicinamibacterales bacterium]
MRAKRYTVLIADRSSGVVRRVGISLRPAIALAAGVFSLPILIGLGAKWSARAEIDQLGEANALLRAENDSYREATGQLTGQIQSLEDVIDDLGERATLAPEQARAIQKLPAVVKSRATGGVTEANRAITDVVASLPSPEDTFGLLRVVLQGLENRLDYVRNNLEKRQELAAATPSIWPAHGWLSGAFGGRRDPFTGLPGFHQGIDISTDRGQPVYATADGTVASAGRAGEYGNLIVLRHAFGLSTRYGHLSRFNVGVGQTINRGDVIGYVGSTGRSTGSHLHYEILVNGRLINPLQLLTQPATR